MVQGWLVRRVGRLRILRLLGLHPNDGNPLSVLLFPLTPPTFPAEKEK